MGDQIQMAIRPVVVEMSKQTKLVATLLVQQSASEERRQLATPERVEREKQLLAEIVKVKDILRADRRAEAEVRKSEIEAAEAEASLPFHLQKVRVEIQDLTEKLPSEIDGKRKHRIALITLLVSLISIIAGTIATALGSHLAGH